MSCTNVGSANNVPLAHIPERGNRSHDSCERAASIIVEKVDGIFRHKESWAESRNNSETLAPHPSLIGLALPLACLAYGLAWNTGTDNIDRPVKFVIRWKRLCFPPSSHRRPVTLKHASRVVVTLNLPLADHAGSLEPEVEAADAGE